jgi:hypothetical protein
MIKAEPSDEVKAQIQALRKKWAESDPGFYMHFFECCKKSIMSLDGAIPFCPFCGLGTTSKTPIEDGKPWQPETQVNPETCTEQKSEPGTY